jgi:hypothetical protein
VRKGPEVIEVIEEPDGGPGGRGTGYNLNLTDRA